MSKGLSDDAHGRVLERIEKLKASEPSVDFLDSAPSIRPEAGKNEENGEKRSKTSPSEG